MLTQAAPHAATRRNGPGQATTRWPVWQDLDVACKTSPVDVVESLLVEGSDQFDLARRLTVELDLDRSLLKACTTAASHWRLVRWCTNQTLPLQ